MKIRKNIAIFLFFLSWIIPMAHRFWNNRPPRMVRWIILDESVQEDIQWYFYDIGNLVSIICIILGVWLVIKKVGESLYIAVSALLLISILDLAHYMLYYKRNEYFLTGEGMIMAVGAILIIKHESIHHNEKTT